MDIFSRRCSSITNINKMRVKRLLSFALLALVCLLFIGFCNEVGASSAPEPAAGEFTTCEETCNIKVIGHKPPKVKDMITIRYFNKGSKTSKVIATIFQWICFVASISMLAWFLFQMFVGSCGWEIIFVGIIESIFYLLEVFASTIPPAVLYCSHGVSVLWLRYIEWLLTCPVLLIHLSNITGLHGEYSERTMTLLVSDQGTILMGTTAAMSKGGTKIFFFICGLCFGFATFYMAAMVYIESYHMVPRGKCRKLVRSMAWAYFCSWPLFPILFLFGPEGFDIISLSGSYIAHCVADLVSKNLWAVLGWWLRYEVRVHIILHGDLRRTHKMEILGKTIEVEEYLDEETAKEAPDYENVQKHSTKSLNRRASMARMAGKLERQGKQIRLSRETDPPKGHGHGKKDIEAGPPSMFRSQRDINPMEKQLEAAMHGRPSAVHSPPYGNGHGNDYLISSPYQGPAAPSAGRPGYYEQKAQASGPNLPPRVCVVTCSLDDQVLRFFEMQLEMMPSQVRVESAINPDALRQILAALQGQGTHIDMVLMQPQFASSFPGVVDEARRRGVPVILFSANPSIRQSLGADDYIDGPTYGMPFNQSDLAALIARWHQSPARPRFDQPPVPGTPGGGGGNMMRSSMGMPPPGGENDMLMSLMGEIERLRGEMARRNSGVNMTPTGAMTPGGLSATPSMNLPSGYAQGPMQ